MKAIRSAVFRDVYRPFVHTFQPIRALHSGLRTTLPVTAQSRLKVSFGKDEAHFGPATVEIETENQKCDMVEVEIFTECKAVEETVRVTPDGEGGVLVDAPDGSKSDGIEAKGLRIVAKIPEKFGLDIRSGGGPVKVARIEGVVSIDSEGGCVVLDKVNEGPCNISSRGGDVECRVINGDANLVTGGGSLSSKRITGVHIQADTGGGPSDIRALYSRTTRLMTGPLTLGSIHGNASIEATLGDVVVESGVDGNIDITTDGGKIDIQLGSSAESVNLKSCGGDIHLRLPQDLAASVDAKGGRGVLVDEAFKDEVKYTDVTCQHVKGNVAAKGQTSGARGYTPTKAVLSLDAASGFVELRGKDWLSSLGAKFQGLRNLK